MSAAAVIYVGAEQYVDIPVTLTVDSAPVDPTADRVQVGFRLYGSTTPMVFHDAAWLTEGSGATTQYYARVQVGVGDFVLAAGVYVVGVRVEDASEIAIAEPTTLLVVKNP